MRPGPHRETAHSAFALLCRLTRADQAHIGAGAAHVEGNQVGQTELRPEPDAADHPAGRTRKEGVDRHPADRAGRNGAAIRLHDSRRAADAEIGDAPFEVLEITVHDRHEAGVDCRRGKTLEFAALVREHRESPAS